MKSLLFASVLLAGCAINDDRVAGAGSASYEYHRTLADGSTCTLSLLTGRDVVGGRLSIDKDCGVVSSADSTKGAVEAIGVINNSINAVRDAIGKVP